MLLRLCCICAFDAVGSAEPTACHVQMSSSQKLTGRTCATALSACVRQGMIWVCPTPGPAPSTDTIPGDACNTVLAWHQLICMDPYSPGNINIRTSGRLAMQTCYISQETCNVLYVIEW